MTYFSIYLGFTWVLYLKLRQLCWYCCVCVCVFVSMCLHQSIIKASSVWNIYDARKQINDVVFKIWCFLSSLFIAFSGWSIDPFQPATLSCLRISNGQSRDLTTIHGFRDSVPVCKMYGCYKVTQKFRATFHFFPNDTRRLQCVDVSNPLQKVLRCVYTTYTYWNCTINKLLYRWKII